MPAMAPFFIAFTGSALLAFLITLFSARLSRRFKFLTKGVPFVGGIAIFVAFLWNYLAFAQPSTLQTGAFATAAAVIFAMGLVDDIFELSVWAKFGLQAVAAVLAISAGMRTQIVFIGPALNYIITFLWIVGITNAFNLLDIMDGLAGACSLVICAGFALVSQLNGGQFLPALTFTTLGGAILGFITMNLPPARVYMGNSGSHFIGFVIAVTSIQVSYADLSKGVALATPLVLMGFPLFDTLFLIVMRLGKSRLPFYKTKDHIALRLKALGYSPRRVLATMLLICMLFSVGGVLVSQMTNRDGVFIIACLALVVILLLRKTLSIIVYE